MHVRPFSLPARQRGEGGPLRSSGGWGNGRVASSTGQFLHRRSPLHHPASPGGPPPPLRSASRGRMSESVPATRPCPSYAIPSEQTNTAGRDLRQTAPGVGPLAITITRGEISSLRGAFATKQSRLCAADPGLLRRHSPLKTGVNALLPRNDEKESGTPKGAVQQPPCLAARRGPCGSRSPLGVPPRHLRSRPNATAQLEPRDFPGQARSAQPRWFERSRASHRTFTQGRRPAFHASLAGVTRALLSQSSEIAPAVRS